MTTAHVFAGARKMKPTLKHRPAIWECMLGTVYARSPEGQVRYFDYDWERAREFAQVHPSRDPRLHKASQSFGAEGPRKGQWVLWVVPTVEPRECRCDDYSDGGRKPHVHWDEYDNDKSGIEFL